MYRLIWLPALALGACGTENDRRPRSVEYITQAILAPNCGNAQCHSSFRNVKGLAFDTVERARESLVNGLVGAIGLDPEKEGEWQGDASSAQLINVLTRTVDRMPYDQPLPEPDIELIARWIEYGAPGAQCNPDVATMVCFGAKLVPCLPDFNYGAVTDCATMGMTCNAGACR
jgi:hypothetical protein